MRDERNVCCHKLIFHSFTMHCSLSVSHDMGGLNGVCNRYTVSKE